MKKILLFLFVIFLIFHSCKKDSVSSYPEMIVGKWQMTSAVPTSQYEPCDFKGYINFQSGNTYSSFDVCNNRLTKGKWKIQENILTVTDDGFPIPFDLTIISLSKSNMTLEFTGIVAKYIKI